MMLREAREVCVQGYISLQPLVDRINFYLGRRMGPGAFLVLSKHAMSTCCNVMHAACLACA